MIVKMKFLSITGPKDDIDRVVEQHLSKYEIHLENTLTELKTVQSLTPYIQINPYKEALKQAQDYVELLSPDQRKTVKEMSLEESLSRIEKTQKTLDHLQEKLAKLKESQKKHMRMAEKISPFQKLPCDLQTLLRFKFITFRFGRMPKEYYGKFKNYIYDSADTIFYECYSNSDYVWGLYFATRDTLNSVDAMFASMHFELIYLSGRYEGTPENAFLKLQEQIKHETEDIETCNEQIATYLNTYSHELMGALKQLNSFSERFDVRRLAACTKTRSETQTFYIICGWMAANDADAFQKDIENDENLFVMVEDGTNTGKEPPTKLKNPKFFRPFEMFVRMYGLPGYKEIDPTIYLALTYSFIFGIMFGDVGQGLVLVIGGFLIYKFKKMDLAAIMATAGISSVIWGFVFNSFFGFEGLFPYEALIHSKTDMITLPLVGSINLVFVLAIAFGMFVILFNMVLNIINSIRLGDKENTWFSQNALAGLVFYGSLVVAIFMFMSGYANINTILPILLVLIVVSLVVIFLKEMLGHIASHKKAIEGGKGMYFVQAFFETFETLLSFLSNTLSYVRIGAYAVSHVAMMEVVMMLAGAEAGSPNPVVIVIGNLFVMALEGLLVAIQVLRLEYYEMFSRFYKGSGREFKPFNKTK